MLSRLLTITAFLASCGASALGQTEQGNRFHVFSGSLGTNLLFGNKLSSTHSLRIDYQRGKFIRDNLAHGWLLSAGTSFYNIDNSSAGLGRYKIVAPSASAGYFVRRYLRLNPSLFPFAQADVKAAYQTFRVTGTPNTLLGNTSNYDTYQLSGGLSVGLSYFFKPGFALEATTGLGTISVIHLQRVDKNSTTLNGNLGTGLGNHFTLGLARYFGDTHSLPQRPFSKRDTLFETGTTYLSGGLQFAFLGNKNQNASREANVATFSFGRFVRSNLVRGVTLLAGYATEQPSLNQKVHTLTIGYRPYREYFGRLPIENLSVFLNAGLQTTYSGTFSRNAQEGTSSSGHELSASFSFIPGLHYRFTPKWALAATFGTANLGNLSVSRSGDGRSTTVYLFASPTLNLSTFGLSLRYFPQRRQAI